MSYINIISSVGNNKSYTPLLVRDCGIEIPAKVGLTYNQNLKASPKMANNALRERSIDEYGTSAVWILGPIVTSKVADKLIKKFGFNPKVNVSLLKEQNDQGIQYNIRKFKQNAPEAVKDLEKVLKNKTKYQNLQAMKFLASTLIPITLMGVILPKLNFKLTEVLNKKSEITNENKKQNNNNKNVSFRGISSTLANMSYVNKMAVTDGGLTISRVATARNKYEQMELGFKNVMMMVLNFVFPIYLAKCLDKFSQKFFNTNVNLDPKLMYNKDFLNAIKNKKLELPNENNIIEFLDSKPNSQFSKLCEEYCDVKYLKNRIRDPREFVDKNKIINFMREVQKFSEEALKSKDIEKYAKKAIKVKSFNILLNLGISSALLAVALPKLIFFLRKKITGSDAEPGLIKNV